ncbi:PaaX family transcriptional regulator C-terminal domain-containing protein [Nocardia salmonicida]|uniref:PaaX family transcriptional regulator n=1 Tax=Nocardia salmonicida TaxID=53431 RepID=UPI00366B055D
MSINSDYMFGTGAWTAQPRQYIVSLYGLYGPRDNNWLPVSAIIRLLGLLDVDAQSVRSSISRLKRREVVTPRRVNGVAGYALKEDRAQIMIQGDERIFGQYRASVDDGWILVGFSVPESERDRRHLLRSNLGQRGFGTVAPGLWIAPAHLRDETVAMLEDLQLEEYVEVFTGGYLGLGELQERARNWWDFDQLETVYQEFIDRNSGLRARPGRRAGDFGEIAFARYVTIVTEWRRLPFADPGLPLEIVGKDWIGLRAQRLFTELRATYDQPARDYARSVIEECSR